METESDWIFGGSFIVCFSIIGCGVVAYVIRECRNKSTMKKSPSVEQLNHEDPVIID
jgi:hypothetical protein